jgi:hypothetical protein
MVSVTKLVAELGMSEQKVIEYLLVLSPVWRSKSTPWARWIFGSFSGHLVQSWMTSMTCLT